MRCDLQTFFIIVVGTATSQYLVWHYIKNRLCVKNLDFTMRTIWKKHYQHYACDNYDLWKHNSIDRIRKRLESDKQRLVLLFYMWNMMWVMLLLFCLPRIWAIPVLLVATTYWAIVLVVSFMTCYFLTDKLETDSKTYLPTFYI